MLKRDNLFLSLDEALTVGWSLHCPQAALWWHSGVVPEERTGLHQELLWLEEPDNGDDDISLGDAALEPPLSFAENDDDTKRCDARETLGKRKDSAGRQRPGFSPSWQGAQGSQVLQTPENARPFILRVAAPWPPLFVWVGAALALLCERNISQGILDTERGPLLVRRTAAADAHMEEGRKDGSPVAPSARRCRRCPWDEWCPALLKEGWNDANGF